LGKGRQVRQAYPQGPNQAHGRRDPIGTPEVGWPGGYRVRETLGPGAGAAENRFRGGWKVGSFILNPRCTAERRPVGQDRAPHRTVLDRFQFEKGGGPGSLRFGKTIS